MFGQEVLQNRQGLGPHQLARVIQSDGHLVQQPAGKEVPLPKVSVNIGDLLERLLNRALKGKVQGDEVFIAANDLDKVKFERNQLLRISEADAVRILLDLWQAPTNECVSLLMAEKNCLTWPKISWRLKNGRQSVRK